MSAPRTMSEEQEREVRARRTPFILALAGELDAERAAYATLERDLAAAQAEVVEAHGIIQWMSGSESFGPGGEAHEGWVKAREALSRTPGSLSALEAMLLQVAGCVWATAAPSVEMDPRECAAIVSRILGKEAAR